jgi:hypothetical protein
VGKFKNLTIYNSSKLPNAIKCGKKGFSIHPKPFFFFGSGLNSDDLDSTWGMESMIITSCAFSGRNFSPLSICQIVFVCICIILNALGTLFHFHQVSSEGLQSRY